MAGARVLLPFGLSAVHALGGVTVADMFPREVRGEKTGWWTLAVGVGLRHRTARSALMLADYAGAVLGTDPLSVHCQGNRQLVLDIWPPRRRFGCDPNLHVRSMLVMIFTKGTLVSLQTISFFFVPETLYFQGNIQEQHRGHRFSVRVKPFEHAEVPEWSTAFFRPVSSISRRMKLPPNS